MRLFALVESARLGTGNEKSPTETVDYSVLQRALSAEVDLYCQQMAKVLAEQVDESVTAGMNTFALSSLHV